MRDFELNWKESWSYRDCLLVGNKNANKHIKLTTASSDNVEKIKA